MRQVLLAGFFLGALAGQASANQVLLYDDEGCRGEYRLLIDSEADLERLEFRNDAESIRVVSGVWTFYRDVNFFSQSGPSLTLQPGGCVTLGEGAAVSFPRDSMDSVQRIQAGGALPGVIVLFDGVNLTPPYRVVIGNLTDLDEQDFNDRVESVQVLQGNWRLYRDENFGTGDGPPTPFGPGTYGDVELMGFPHDEASSVMRIPD